MKENYCPICEKSIYFWQKREKRIYNIREVRMFSTYVYPVYGSVHKKCKGSARYKVEGEGLHYTIVEDSADIKSLIRNEKLNRLGI